VELRTGSITLYPYAKTTKITGRPLDFAVPVEATNKLLRYEAHLNRQLYRAMDQLERLQRQRRGEKVPPPLNINLVGGTSLFAKQSQEVRCCQVAVTGEWLTQKLLGKLLHFRDQLRQSRSHTLR
jgi:hypothetical protein